MNRFRKGRRKRISGNNQNPKKGMLETNRMGGMVFLPKNPVGSGNNQPFGTL